MLEVKPMSKPRTLRQWYTDRNMIDMEPTYQRRGDIWPLKNQRLLINSILNDYDIPKIYLADFTYQDTPLKEEKKPYAIIDGKQRLTIFFDFFGDSLKLDSTPVYYQGHELTLSAFTYSRLKERYPSLARRFDQHVPTVMSVISDKKEDVQELFIRLNTNVSISGAERRNAMPGPLPLIIRRLSVHRLFLEYVRFAINRGQDLNTAAKIIQMEHRNGFANSKKKDLDEFVKSNANRRPSDFQAAYTAADRNLTEMTRVFGKRDALLANQAQFPPYYWLVRSHKGQSTSTIRSFLEEFEEQRRLVRKIQRERAEGKNIPIPDDTLVDYNTFVRTPDDSSNQELMYGILRRRLPAYVERH